MFLRVEMSINEHNFRLSRLVTQLCVLFESESVLSKGSYLSPLVRLFFSRSAFSRSVVCVFEVCVFETPGDRAPLEYSLVYSLVVCPPYYQIGSCYAHCIDTVLEKKYAQDIIMSF